MAVKFSQGIYQPLNPQKYIGKKRPIYRSGWELTMMRFLDNHPNIIFWSSEDHRLPYFNPLTGKQTFYIPDFFIVYDDSNGKRHVEMVEVKPSSQILGNATSVKDKYQSIINEAKWKSARYWCKKKGIQFRVITENDIYNRPSKNKKRRKR